MLIKDLVCTNFRDHISLLNEECLLVELPQDCGSPVNGWSIKMGDRGGTDPSMQKKVQCIFITHGLDLISDYFTFSR